MRKEIVWYLWHPLGVLWLMFAAAIAGGVIEWVFFDRSPWEGFGAALVLAGVIKIVAHVKGIPAWPPRQRGDQAAASETS